jgi:hypothetical protein
VKHIYNVGTSFRLQVVRRKYSYVRLFKTIEEAEAELKAILHMDAVALRARKMASMKEVADRQAVTRAVTSDRVASDRQAAKVKAASDRVTSDQQAAKVKAASDLRDLAEFCPRTPPPMPKCYPFASGTSALQHFAYAAEVVTPGEPFQGGHGKGNRFTSNAGCLGGNKQGQVGVSQCLSHPHAGASRAYISVCSGIVAHVDALVKGGFYDSREHFAAFHSWSNREGYGANPHVRLLLMKHTREAGAPEHECATIWADSIPPQTLFHHDYLPAYAYNTLLRFPGGKHKKTGHRCGPGAWGFIQHPVKHNEKWRAGAVPHAATVDAKLRGDPTTAQWCSQRGPMFLVLDSCANVWYQHCACTQRDQDGCVSVLIQFTTVTSSSHVCAGGGCRWENLAEKSRAQIRWTTEYLKGSSVMPFVVQL